MALMNTELYKVRLGEALIGIRNAFRFTVVATPALEVYGYLLRTSGGAVPRLAEYTGAGVMALGAVTAAVAIKTGIDLRHEDRIEERVLRQVAREAARKER